MQKDMILNNFRVLSTQPVEELAAVLYEMRHEKTGARLVWLDRVSDNKTFGIAFRTIPENDTGVFHILEHSVLNGSRNYPVKEPFVELMKSSMQTFLNAFTYPDKTVYPVSSRNDKDFINLMRIYLDAVFFPAIYEKPEIFWQEGWHYECAEETTYKGVVFNEMKGAFASSDTLLQNEINRLMFPDTCYKYVSGGDPAHIPELSYEQFLENHRKFYHPANSYIFLDGSIELDACLKILDEEYLCHFADREMHTEIPFQKPVTGESTIYYELSPTESLEGRSRVAWAYGLGDYTCRKESMAMYVLSDLLCGSNHAPLKQCILSAGLAEDVAMGVMDGQQQNLLIINADNIADGQEGKIKALMADALREQVQKGLDHEHIRATLANMELRYRERDYGYMPQGLGFGNEVLNSWLYGGDPAANLSMAPLFAELNRLVDTGWYEALLERVVLGNDHCCQVLLLPSHTVGQQRQQAEADRLAAAEAQWSDTEREQLLSQQERLDAWQASQDSPEDLAKLPHLELSDISEKPEDVPTELDEADGVPLLRHELATGGISYWNLYFDITDFNEAQLSDTAFLCNALGNLGTKKYTALELQKQIAFCMGELNFSIQSFSKENNPDTCCTYLCASFSCLESKLSQAMRLILEILNATDFSDEGFLRELLLQSKLQLENMVIDSGNSVAMKRVMAGVSAEGVVMEVTSGYSYLQAVKAMEKEVASLPQRLQGLCAILVDAGRLTLSITGSQEDLPIAQLLEDLPCTQRQLLDCGVKPWGTKKEGIVFPADVYFAVQGGLLPHSGQMQVLSQVVSLAYLWNAIRVQGGAYGAGMGTADRGCGVLYSYRDPDAVGSLACYRQIEDFVREFVSWEPDLTGFIIGTISGTEPVLLPGRQGKAADSWYFKEMTYDSRCACRREILHTSAEDLLKLAEEIGHMVASGGVCVVGPQTQVENAGLDRIYSL